jgi:hypothetical protein
VQPAFWRILEEKMAPFLMEIDTGAVSRSRTAAGADSGRAARHRADTATGADPGPAPVLIPHRRRPAQ